MKSTIIIAAFLVLATGCAAERVAKEGVAVVRDIGTTLVSKIPIDEGHMQANGRMVDPKYKGRFLMVQGFEFELGVDGIELRGDLYGQGSGGNNTVDPEVARIVKENRDRPEMLHEKVLDYMVKKAIADAKVTTTQPSTP